MSALQMIQNNFGYLTDKTTDLLAQENPTKRVLVRCGASRFITTARDVKHLVKVVSESQSDYVRYVSLYNGG